LREMTDETVPGPVVFISFYGTHIQ
jgi:hypothetical protein